MQALAVSFEHSSKRVLAGHVLTVLTVAFMIFDGVAKLMKVPQVVQATTVQLGFAESAIVPIGLLLLACTALYAVPRTAVLGAVLLTGYFGGAVAADVRAGDPLFETIFPILFVGLVRAGVFTREPGLRELLPVRR